jgi:hypothetical protein
MSISGGLGIEIIQKHVNPTRIERMTLWMPRLESYALPLRHGFLSM